MILLTLLENVKALSKKSTEEVVVVFSGNHCLVSFTAVQSLFDMKVTIIIQSVQERSRDVHKRNYSTLRKPPGDSEQGAVGSPSQAAAEGALLQLRDLNFLPLDEEGSHSDHWPHSAQTPAAVDIMIGS